jgi:putative colanic acid biosynthesis acetyltransferase WcaF
MDTINERKESGEGLLLGADSIDLSRPDNTELVRGAPLWIEALWYFLGLPLLRSPLITSSAFRCILLRMFGAKIGRGVYIKPGLRVKFPWYLAVGEHSWLGEDLWIDNLAEVNIEAHCCLSQGAYLCTGNHDWSSFNMRLYRQPITCRRGSWVGAKAVLCPGVVVGAGAIVSAGSVVTKNISDMEVHAGNPAQFVRHRKLGSNEVMPKALENRFSPKGDIGVTARIGHE